MHLLQINLYNFYVILYRAKTAGVQSFIILHHAEFIDRNMPFSQPFHSRRCVIKSSDHRAICILHNIGQIICRAFARVSPIQLHLDITGLERPRHNGSTYLYSRASSNDKAFCQRLAIDCLLLRLITTSKPQDRYIYRNPIHRIVTVLSQSTKHHFANHGG